jgi:hypothetical protein
MARRHGRARPRAVPARVAVAWYDATQWAKLKQVAQDADSLDDSYEDWQRGAERLERDLRRKGIEIQRAYIDVDSLVGWCASRQKPINGEARSEYAAQLAANREPS